MDSFGIIAPVLGLLLILVFAGVHIAVALGLASLLGIYISTGSLDITLSALASTAFEGVRNYIFAALPLFMLMGEFISRSGAAGDLYVGINRVLRRVPGRLAIATILGNAVFSFLSGISIAGAAAFTRIAYPQMRSFGYDKGVALGAIAGSACLGMLIPPSNLMILWAILVEASIGRLFLAGIVPGLLLTAMFVVFILINAALQPSVFGDAPLQDDLAEPRRAVGAAAAPALDSVGDNISTGQMAISVICIGGMIITVLGGLWFGIFTATEAAGIGALLALAFSVIFKGLRWHEIVEGILQVGRTAGPLMVMILLALLYSRALALTGIGNAIQSFFSSGIIPHWMVLGFMIVVWFILGMIIDSKSIMLLTVPIFAPLGTLIGYDPIAFAVIGIISIEAGLLTPPFGIIVYTVKGAAEDDSVSILSIFASSTPYWIMLLLLVVLIAVWPQLATGLGNGLL